MIEQITITRLKTLRPGETLIYYKGNFANDIARSVAADSVNIKPAVKYAATLKYIQETAVNLERQGRVRLSYNVVELPKLPPLRTTKTYENHMIEYVATGI